MSPSGSRMACSFRLRIRGGTPLIIPPTPWCRPPEAKLSHGIHLISRQSVGIQISTCANAWCSITMRNKFFGPGINTWDTVLQKTTRIFERMSVQCRAEVYNLFNRVQFNQPGNLTSDPGTFGQSTGEVTRPDGTSGARQVQFGLKFQF